MTALILLSASFIYQLFVILSSNEGQFVYLLDDAYIHLTLARNFSNDFIPAINTGEFAHLSSSPLWTAILSVFYLMGFGGEWLPLILNIIIAVLFTYYLVFLFVEKGQGILLFLIVYILVLFSGSMSALIFLGMEHLLHTFLSLIFILKINKFLDTRRGIYGKEMALMIMLSILLTTIRYEAGVLIFVGSVFLLYRRKYGIATIILIAGILPHLIIGIFAMSRGWQFLPSSIILKSNLLMESSVWLIIKSVILSPAKKLILNPELLVVMFLVAGFLFINFKNRNTIETSYSTLLMLIIVMCLHLIVAEVGWFYRYEAYLLIIGIVVIGLNYGFRINEMSGKKLKAIIIFSVLLCVPLLARGYKIFDEISVASKNIYQQQFQTAKFLSMYYNDETIAVNDIGLVSYKTSCRIIDLWGLAYKPVFDLKRDGLYDTYKVEDILDKEEVKIVAVYAEWFNVEKGFPNNWYYGGTMIIDNNIVCGSDAVSYFAKDSISFDKLKIHLEQFSNKLPKGVTLRINYKD